MPTGRSGSSPLPSRWRCCGRSSLSATLAGSPGRVGSGRRAGALRGALVVSEFALALPLLIGAGLLLNSFLRLQRVGPGFDPSGVYGLAVSLPAGRYATPADVKTFWRRVEARAAEADGVTAAGLAGSLPPDNFGDVNNFDLLDKPVPAGTAQHLAPWSAVSPGFFAAMGIPLLDGRLITPGDSATAPPVVVVSRAWAATYYPNESPIGKQLYSGGCTSSPPTPASGVVGRAGGGGGGRAPDPRRGPRLAPPRGGGAGPGVRGIGRGDGGGPVRV